MQTLRYLMWLHAWEMVGNIRHNEGDFLDHWNEKRDYYYEVWPWGSGNADKEWKAAVKRERKKCQR